MKNAKPSKAEIILAAAKELFWKHGFKRVSIEEICAKAVISKMTFYRFYSNKTELAKAVFDGAVKEGNDNFKQILNSSVSPDEKIKKIILLKFEGTNNISQEFLMDFYSSKEPELNNYVIQKTEEVWQNVIQDFRLAQQQGIFRNDFKPEIILYMAQRVIEILNDPKVLKLYDNPQDIIMEVANLFMYGIAPHK